MSSDIQYSINHDLVNCLVEEAFGMVDVDGSGYLHSCG